ncbi:MAG TPA: Flp pilus assembly protein CpaB [Planctomycetaceae bacterium]|nr:Flp pilus assembly protein CpaB [Planctomycetaceae bacterium]
MRNKSMFLIIACVCGAVAAVGASQLIQGQSTNPIQTTEIFVAAREIGEATQLTADMMTLEQWPADRVPQGATNDLTLLEGKIANQRFFAGEPVMLAKLIDDGAQLNARIPEGFSVVSMAAEGAKSVGNLVRPGDRVNVMAWFSKSDQIPETGVRTVLRGVKVFAVDGRTTRSTKPNDSELTGAPNTVSLLIYKSDEEAWTYASELGRIRLSLSAPDDTADTQETRQAGEQFLAWLRTHQTPPKAEVVVAAPTVEPQRSGFKMLKLHGEHWTEYEVPAGNSPPVVTATSVNGSQGGTKNSGGGVLTGGDSPFFAPSDPIPSGQDEVSMQD